MQKVSAVIPAYQASRVLPACLDALASDRIYMMNGQRENDETPAAAVTLTGSNFRRFPMRSPTESPPTHDPSPIR